MSDNFSFDNSTFVGSAFGSNNVVGGGGPAVAGPAEPAPVDRQVFVVRGRDSEVNEAMDDFLRRLDLNPLDWEAVARLTGKAAPHILDVVRTGFEVAAATVVLLTPDDFAYLHSTLREPDDAEFESKVTGQPRANVLFEAGMAFALHQDRTLMVQVGLIKPFSDVSGIDFIRIDGSPAKLNNIAQRLERAGCRVNTTGTRWLDTGPFRALAALQRRA
jgi:predicted nucleotide-binding protein